MTDRAWWQQRGYAIGLCCLMAVPLLRPEIPPITDLLGHIGRYGVELGRGHSPFLQRYYGFQWGLIGNLGIDLLVVPLGRLLGVELAVKLIVLLIPPLTAGGLLWIAREAHGRIPASAAFALPFAYGYPFQFGFANYCLSMALAFLAFGGWLRLGRLGRFRARAIAFVPIGLALWICHIYGWAVLCLMAAAAELVRARGTGAGRQPFLATLWRAGVACLPLVPPLVLMLAWRSGAVAGGTTGFFLWWAKLSWVLAALRDDVMRFDLVSVLTILVFLTLGLMRIGFRYDRMLGLATLFLMAAYILMPRILIGSAYADMRLAPYALAIGVIALRPTGDSRGWRSALAVAGLAFLLVRLGAHTLHYARLDRAYRDQLQAVPHLPIGARVMVLVSLPCQASWSYSRMDHLGSLAIGRRQAFVNGQWTMAGAQLLTIRNPGVGRFGGDPTQLLRPLRCRSRREPILTDTVAHFPRAAYDHLWLIDMPRAGWIRYPDLVPVWHGRERGILYRVVPVAGSATSASDTPKGSDPRATM